MEKYIEGNKAAWEEAFDNRDASWGADITERIQKEDYPFFNEETKSVLKKIDTNGAVIGQFCCNNGRELLSLVKCGNAKKRIGFDIAENQVAFANEKAKELDLPCIFEAVNIYDIGDRYKEQFDVVLITIGALCWFDDLDRFFAIIAKCMKPGAVIVLNEQHPFTNMLATEGDAEFEELCTFLREARIERAGVFPFSPEEGTPAEKMPHPDAETAAARADAVLGIQGEFLDAFAESLVGSRLPVLIEQHDEEADFWIGRSYADSPEIDSMVYVRGSCSPGDMPTVLVESSENGILYGHTVESEESLC